MSLGAQEKQTKLARKQMTSTEYHFRNKNGFRQLGRWSAIQNPSFIIAFSLVNGEIKGRETLQSFLYLQQLRSLHISFTIEIGRICTHKSA